MTTTPDRRPVLGAMYTGLVLTVVAAVAPYLDRATTGVMAAHVRAGYPDYAQADVDSAVTTYLVLASVVGGLGALCWLATIWAVRTGRGWASWTATGLLVLGAVLAATGMFTRDTSGDTGLPLPLGSLWALPCLAGLVAVVLLWRRGAQQA